MSHECEFAGFAAEDFEVRIEKELVMSELCGDLMAPVDQLSWLELSPSHPRFLQTPGHHHPDPS